MHTGIEGVAIRFAKREDVSLVLQFIQDLAAYERLSHEVVADEERLEQTLFGEHPAAEVVLAFEDDQPAAFALFFHNYSTFLARPGLYLEDLFVRNEYRGRGIGRMMLAFLARLAVQRGCGRFEWWVLDWNQPAIGFYRKLRAQSMDEWTVFRVDGDRLRDLASEFGRAEPAQR